MFALNSIHLNSRRWSSDKRWTLRAWNGGENWIWCDVNQSADQQFGCQHSAQYIPALLHFQVHYQLRYFNVASILRDSVLTRIRLGNEPKPRVKFLKFYKPLQRFGLLDLCIRIKQILKIRTKDEKKHTYETYLYTHTYHVKQVP